MDLGARLMPTTEQSGSLQPDGAPYAPPYFSLLPTADFRAPGQRVGARGQFWKLYFQKNTDKTKASKIPSEAELRQSGMGTHW